MRTVLYASLTANGYFGRGTGGRALAPEVRADFVSHVERAGNVIMGRRTFDFMRQADAAGLLPGADMVVLTSGTGELPGAQVVNRPQEALELVKGKGHDTAFLGGGATADDAFLRAGLVDELYLYVLPYLSGPALNISLADGEFADTRLLGTARLGDSVVQLHYELSR